MNGSLELVQGNDKKEAIDFYIERENKKQNLKWRQIYHQHSYITNYFGKAFKEIRKKDKSEHYRIDHYLLFEEPLDKRNIDLHVTTEKWLKITTTKSFFDVFMENQKGHPFSLTEDDIRFLAKVFLHLRLRDEKNAFEELKPAITRLHQFFNSFSEYELDEQLYTILDEFDIKFPNSLKTIEEGIDQLLMNKETAAIKKNELHEMLDAIKIKGLKGKLLRLLNDRFIKNTVSLNNEIKKQYESNHSNPYFDFDNVFNHYKEKIAAITDFRQTVIDHDAIFRTHGKDSKLYYNRILILTAIRIFRSVRANEI